jgi:hypothetical protein
MKQSPIKNFNFTILNIWLTITKNSGLPWSLFGVTASYPRWKWECLGKCRYSTCIYDCLDNIPIWTEYLVFFIWVCCVMGLWSGKWFILWNWFPLKISLINLYWTKLLTDLFLRTLCECGYYYYITLALSFLIQTFKIYHWYKLQHLWKFQFSL